MVIKRERDIAGAEAAARIVVQVHERLVDFLQPGQTLADIDAFVGQSLKSLKAKSCFINYQIQVMTLSRAIHVSRSTIASCTAPMT